MPTDDRLVMTGLRKEDEDLDTSLRPHNLREYIGQEKVDESDLSYVPANAGPVTPIQEDAAQEALAALQALGYTAAEAAKAVSQVRGQSDSANEIVRLALRNMAGF